MGMEVFSMLLVVTAVLVPLVRLVVLPRPEPVPPDHPDAARLRAELAAVRARATGSASTTRWPGRPVGRSSVGLVGAPGSGS
jgi:hypothetical protein